ncbi:uncharacterized protein LOC109797153 [Cajanus cajan]|uniref:Senescence regulator S40 n=1 Tax=Cajanus cajan TaxID=3821 RepID=A0A151TRR4_CAJCA|nr:uncharacterized protein LOC109797153 [Cajanus cajan]KYP69748.1 hypothetical protein KK1_008949 [Cajanus cajan]
MASRKNFLSKPSRYIFPATSDTHLSPTQQEGIFEFDEAELWNHSEATKKGLPSSGSRSLAKRASRNNNKVDHGGGGRVGPASLPVNIPDWSKILKEDYKEHPKWESDGDDEEEHVGDEGNQRGFRVPPHEYLARTRGASLSVHEGIGRTLKGRDLRSVRNAIWKKVGFED